MIEAVLAESRGRISGPRGAAAKLRIPRQTLESKIAYLGINNPFLLAKPQGRLLHERLPDRRRCHRPLSHRQDVASAGSPSSIARKGGDGVVAGSDAEGHVLRRRVSRACLSNTIQVS
jgi:hypothetical protein